MNPTATLEKLLEELKENVTPRAIDAPGNYFPPEVIEQVKREAAAQLDAEEKAKTQSFLSRLAAKLRGFGSGFGKKGDFAKAKAEARDETREAPKAELGPPLVALFRGLFDASKVVNRYFKDARGTVYQYRASGMIVRAVRKNSKERRRRDLRAICLRHARPGKPVHRLMHEARSFPLELPTGAQPEDRAA